MKTKIYPFIGLALLLLLALWPSFATAQRSMGGDSVVYEGVVIDGTSRTPWCAGRVYAMNRQRQVAKVYVDDQGRFRLAVSSTTAALPNLRIFVERNCKPHEDGPALHCVYEMPAPDRSQSGIKIVIGGECGRCSCI